MAYLINAITHNTTITNEDNSFIDKSKFDWGPVNGLELWTIPSIEGTINDNVQPDIASPRIISVKLSLNTYVIEAQIKLKRIIKRKNKI